MNSMKQKSEHFSPKEAQTRFETALRGARIAAHHPMKSMTPKRPEAQRKKKKTNEKAR